MFAKFTVLLAVAAVAMGSPVPQDPLEPILSLLGDLPIIGTIIDSLPIATPAPSGLDALPGEIESILSSLLGGAVPTAIIPIAAPPASPTDILGLSSILNEIESLLGDLGLPAGLLSLTDAEKREDDVPSPGLPLSLLPLPAPTPTVTAAGAGNGTAAPPTPVSGALKPTGTFTSFIPSLRSD
ncbi:hypothetical protein C8Q78DRAFT_30698 [Trametes maxima]|nr:hypothetical protein C8Q78DRAFT_30698 [Trametes maxima]